MFTCGRVRQGNNGVGCCTIIICDESKSELTWSVIQWNKMECKMHIWVGVWGEVGEDSRFTGQFTIWTPPYLREKFPKLTLCGGGGAQGGVWQKLL